MPDGRIRTAGSEVNSATPPPITIREDSLWAFVMNYSHPKPNAAGYAVLALLTVFSRSEEHTSELQSRLHLVCRLLLEKKKLAWLAPTISSLLATGVRVLTLLPD